MALVYSPRCGRLLIYDMATVSSPGRCWRYWRRQCYGAGVGCIRPGKGSSHRAHHHSRALVALDHPFCRGSFADAPRPGGAQCPIDEVLAFGPVLDERTARRLVRQSVLRFNELNDGWICTIEREDICEELDRIIELCGFSCDDEDWLAGRDW